ncbi:EamA family transporter RarD [Moraxella catarrhalis]|nr:EamA family transporter RarD [Moraxella catarrhalis]OAU97357.1 Protein rarD [Moraxella catarrhalis]OAU97907.1 Protein rarD [Moraxella catarrhalis]
MSHLLTGNKLMIGVILAALSNVLFGVLYAYSKWMAPLTGTQVFFWRMVMMWLCMAAFLVMTGKMAQVKSDLQAIRGAKSWVYLLLPTPILASQLWLFMWAPVNGQSIQVSMGYFLFPLTMVVAGFLVFRERLTKLQTLAVALAAAGVSVEIWRTSGISWATLWVCGTYPIYYVMRRLLGVRALSGLFVDLSIIAPICLAGILMSDAAMVTSSGTLLIKALGLGAISVLAMATNIEASRLLPVSLFGMLSYLEPVLLFILSITILGSVFSLGMLVSYGLIWAAVVCLIIQGLFANRQKDEQRS